MTETALTQFAAIMLGGLLTIASGIVTTTVLERQRHRRDSRSLALAFKGEITALLEFINERRYVQRFNEVIRQMEETNTPFYMPFHLRFRYDRVYEGNVGRIGLLHGKLPEHIPLFYTRLTSILEDMVNIGGGLYGDLDLPLLIRIHRDLLRELELALSLGRKIIDETDRQYGGN